MPTVLPASRARRTVSILRRARRFGRSAAGDGLILTTTCMPSVTASRSPPLAQPETGRGDASLWTAAAAPDHKLWTTLRGPVDPSRLPTSPHPRRRLRVASEQSITTNQREDIGPYSGCASPSRQRSLSQALTGGPFLNIEVGRSGLMLLWSVKGKMDQDYAITPSPSRSTSRTIASQSAQLPPKPSERPYR
jgi:hypothetical protein